MERCYQLTLCYRIVTSDSTPLPGTSSSSSGPVKQHKLFLTDGWACGFMGVCIYMFRINNSKQLPEEGFHKDL